MLRTFQISRILHLYGKHWLLLVMLVPCLNAFKNPSWWAELRILKGVFYNFVLAQTNFCKLNFYLFIYFIFILSFPVPIPLNWQVEIPPILHGLIQIPYSPLYFSFIWMQDFITLYLTTPENNLNSICFCFHFKLELLSTHLKCVLKLMLFVLLKKKLLNSKVEEQILSISSLKC